MGLARTRTFVSRTTLTVAGYGAVEHASGLPEGRLPSLRWLCPGQPERPCSPGAGQDSRRPGGAGVPGRAPLSVGKVALGGRTSCARLRFQSGGILLRQVNRQVHEGSFQINAAASRCETGKELSVLAAEHLPAVVRSRVSSYAGRKLGGKMEIPVKLENRSAGIEGRIPPEPKTGDKLAD